MNLTWHHATLLPAAEEVFTPIFYQEQSNSVANQIAALNSQLNETRQGVINVGGMMTGNAGRQTSTSTQV